MPFANSIIGQFMNSPANSAGNSCDDALRDYLMLDRLRHGLCSENENLSSDVADGETAFTKIKNFLIAKGFLFTNLDKAIIYVLQEKDKPHVDAVVTIVFDANKIHAGFVGEPALLEEFKCFFEEAFNKNGSLVSIATGIGRSSGNLTFDRVHLSEADTNQAKQVFYPFMKQSLATYFDKFMASSENVLVLYGPPGTGKSTFLRTLISTKTNRAYVVYNKSVIESDELMKGFFSSKAQLLALEDIDNYMSNRAEGNALMSGFLNASEGIVKRSDKKIVFATNLPSIDKIDPALLRRGRCFDVIHFDLLTVEQARAVEVEMNLPEQDLSGKKRWALSEILNPVSVDLQMHDRAAKAIGF